MSQPPMQNSNAIHGSMMSSNTSPMMAGGNTGQMHMLPNTGMPQQMVAAMPCGNQVTGPGMAPVPNNASMQQPVPIQPQQHQQPSQSQTSSSGGGGGSHGGNQQQPQDVPRMKHLLQQLKESLANLMRVASANILHNSQLDNGTKLSEEPIPRFEKALEDFYSTCNQIELCLRTILESAIQTRTSQTYLPYVVSKETLPDPQQSAMENNINYTQYLSVIKKQVACAKTMYEIFADVAKQIQGPSSMGSLGPH